MKLLIVVFFVSVVGLLAAVTSIPRSHSGSTIGRALQDMQTARAAKLPAEDFDDRSLVLPRESKH
jgi:hypothetical protein